MMAPEYSEFLKGDDIRHSWACDGCDYRFKTLITFEAAAA
jgi:hypothetical protein